jgi:hypothetical protein
MLKKTKGKAFKIVAGVLLAAIFGGAAFLMFVRGEFVRHLEVAYPDNTFQVGFVLADPIYGNYVSKATCLEDYTEFAISKSWNTKKISDNYPTSKSQSQYNAMIGDVFKASSIIGEIESVTGGGKKPFDGSGNYDQINFHLADEKEHALDVEEILRILESSCIEAETIYFTYEKEKHVYQILLSADDYDLNEEEIQKRIEMIK